MKDSGYKWLGKIPDDWKVEKVKNLFSERKHKNKGLVENNLLSLSYGNIIRKNINTTFGLLPESFETYNIIEAGDVVFRLTDLQNDKKSLRTGLCKEKGIITSAYTVLIPPKNVSPVFCHYLFHSFDICKVFYNLGDGVRQGMNYCDLAKMPFLLPPLDVQKKIADFLDSKCTEIQATIDNTKQTIEEYKKLKTAVITKAVTKGIRPNRKMKDSDIEWIGQIPEDWRIVKIKILTTKVGSGKTPKGGAEIYQEEGVLFIRSQNVYDEGLSLLEPTYISDEIDEDMANTRVQDKDVLLNITGGSIGRCCIYDGKFGRANVNQHVSIIRVIPGKVLPDLMHYFWNSYMGKTSIDLYQTGGNREGMSADAIKNTFIPFPPLSEQSEIAAYLDKKSSQINTVIAQKEQFITEMEKYKQSFIYEYVTGKREVN